MNELPVIGSLRLPKNFLDRNGANIASCKRLFDVQKTDFRERDQCFFAAVLSEMDKDNVNSRKL